MIAPDFHDNRKFPITLKLPLAVVVKSPRKTKNSLRKQEQKTDTKTENTNGNINENQPKKELLNIEATAS